MPNPDTNTPPADIETLVDRQVREWRDRMAKLAVAAVMLTMDATTGVALVRLRSKPEPGIIGSGGPLGWQIVTGDGQVRTFQSRALAAMSDPDKAIEALIEALHQRQQANTPQG